MPSAWIENRRTARGVARIVRFRLGGRETSPSYGGSFKTLREAKIRRDYIAGELAAMRVPNLRLVEPQPSPVLGDVGEAWRRSRVDVVETTQKMHRSDLGRIYRVCPTLRRHAIDLITVDDVVSMISALTEKGYKR